MSLAGLNAGSYPAPWVPVSPVTRPTRAERQRHPGRERRHAPNPPVIIGEQPIFLRKTNKKGKPIGSPVLSGFVFDFSDPLNPSSAANPANYQVDTITTKRVKKQTRRILHPITSFSVAYGAANDSVTLTFAGKQTSGPAARSPWSVDRPPASPACRQCLGGSKVFTISPGGQNIVGQ